MDGMDNCAEKVDSIALSIFAGEISSNFLSFIFFNDFFFDQASTVSLQDCIIRRGFDFNILNPLTVPRVPGFDMVGEIYAKGSKVHGFEEGDRVAAFLPNGGGNAKYITLKTEELVSIPAELEVAEAATMVSIYTTAYQVLRQITVPGTTFTLNDKKVLIILGYGRTDPIGHALIQMCQKARAVVLVTAPTHQHDYYRTVWNVVPLPNDPKEWIQRVQYRMDYVFDGLCEDGLKTPYRALKPNNTNCELVCYGYTSMLKQSSSMGILGAPIRGHFYRLRAQLLSSLSSSPSTPASSKRIKFVDLYNNENYIKDLELYKKNLKSLFQLLKLNKVKPNIIRKIPLSQVAEAQLEIESIIQSSENEETNVEGMSKENQKLSILEKHIKEHGIIVCLPWMKDPARKKRIKEQEADSKAIGATETPVDAKPNDDAKPADVAKQGDETKQGDTSKEEQDQSDEEDETRGEIMDDDDGGTRSTTIPKTIHGGATVCTDSSSLNSQFPLLFCY
jgi:NADPH:quinone reductase-like Zn-dependent oxidoreductase